MKIKTVSIPTEKILAAQVVLPKRWKRKNPWGRPSPV